jgi:hypothetical protein
VASLGAERSVRSGNLIIIDRSWSARTSVVQQSFDGPEKAPTPLANYVLVEAKHRRNGLGGHTFCAPDNNPTAIGP